MPLALVLAFQAAAVPVPAPLLQLDFDLARYRAPELGLPGRTCDRSDPSAITVCARRGAGAYPLAEMARIYEPRRLVAEMGVAGNLSANVHLDGVAMDRGAISKRVLIGLR